MTRVHPIASCLKRTVLLWLVVILTSVWTPTLLLAQDDDAVDVRRKPDATADLLGQMTELMEKSGTAGNPDIGQNLSGLLQSPDFQALLKSVMASGDLNNLASHDSSSASSRKLLGLLPLSLLNMVVLAYAANLLLARILFAVNVFINARRLISNKTPPLLMGPALWALAVVMGGMLVVVLYWLMHHSTLSKLPQRA